MSAPESTDEEFTTWQEIAAYLQKSKRTAQLWEKRFGLPVKRMGGKGSSQVTAKRRDLDEWLTAQKQKSSADSGNQNDSGTERLEPAASHSNPLQERNSTSVVVSDAQNQLAEQVATLAPDQGHWRLSAASALVLGLALSWYLSQIGASYPARLASCRVVGNVLTALDSQGQKLWEFVLPGPPDPDSVSPRLIDRISRVADLEGDGSPELLFTFSAPRHQARDQLYCFSADGKLRWTYSNSRSVVTRDGQTIDPPYFISQVQFLNAPQAGASRVMVGSNHHYSFPYQVAVLDAQGKMISEYWHRGHLVHSAIGDLDGDGGPEVVLGGVNDSKDYRRATLAVFDSRLIQGSSVAPDGTPDFIGVGRSSEKLTVFFGRSSLSLLEEFNRVQHIIIGAKSISVAVAEGIAEDSPSVVYELSSGFRLLSITLSDNYRNRVRELESQGRLSPGTLATEVQQLRQSYKVLPGIPDR